MNTQEYIRLINNQKENLIKIDMKEKINLVELLKDCPAGMELDCTMFEGLEFDSIVDNSPLPIRCRILNPDGYGYNIYNFTKYGCWNTLESAKCVIFPKGKTTWEGFVPPCKFKDGDICYIKTEVYEHIFIFKDINRNNYYVPKYVNLKGNVLSTNDDPICLFESVKEFRLATEDEKQKLFDAIKANGYKWNQDSKTLDKLIKPKFKVGNIIKNKYTCEIATIEKICDSTYMASLNGTNIYIDMTLEEHWELVPNKFDISTLVPFESKVLVRQDKTDVWRPAYYGFFNQHNKRFYTTSNGTWLMCIPYNEDTKHLTGTTYDCDDFYKTW